MNRNLIKKIVRSKFFDLVLSKLKIGIIDYNSLLALRLANQELHVIRNSLSKSLLNTKIFLHFTNHPLQNSSDLFEVSKSQLCQDFVALNVSNFKDHGYFVEFGATNGLDLSNTYMLESQFSWTGILVEPAKVWHDELTVNRPNSIIEHYCVWSKSGQKISFHEAQIPELSRSNNLEAGESEVESGQIQSEYFVETISLRDLLIKHNAPRKIDYLSLDTEGSEYEILRDFNFNEFEFAFISCEHNFTPKRELIYDLLTKNGYIRVCSEISAFDDWYVFNS